jgi:hydroxyacylglutathione hydrolase
MGERLIHEILPVGMLQCNCQIVGDPATREALVIDPGDEVERVLDILKRHDLTVRAIVSTHAHIDHVGGLAKLHQVTGAPVLMHPDDLELYLALPAQAEWLGIPPPPVTEVEGFLRDGDDLRWGGLQALVIHTPGHSRGSMSLYLPPVAGQPAPEGPDARELRNTPEPGVARPAAPAAEALIETPRLFAGDTLFAGSIGRTDLWGGSLDQILRSIHQKLLVLPDHTLVFPGHGPATTIAEEKRTNPFVNLRS